jgi:hypothetical protein
MKKSIINSKKISKQKIIVDIVDNIAKQLIKNLHMMQ